MDDGYYERGSSGPYGINHRSNLQYTERRMWIPNRLETGGGHFEKFLEVTPRPGRVPPNAGHWRTTNETKVVAGETVLRGGSRPKSPPRLQPRPTGGKTNQPRVSHTKPKRRPKPVRSGEVQRRNVPDQMGMTELHSQWALGIDVCDGILEATTPNDPRKGNA